MKTKKEIEQAIADYQQEIGKLQEELATAQAQVTPDGCLAALHELHNAADTESAHVTADALLCGFLLELGYADIVAAYEQINKWYA